MIVVVVIVGLRAMVFIVVDFVLLIVDLCCCECWAYWDNFGLLILCC